MNGLLNAMAIAIGKSINIVILVWAAVTVYGFVITMQNNKKLSEDIEASNRKKRGTPRHVKGGIQWNPEEENLGEAMDYMRRLDAIELSYSMYAQFVPIFPLLGLLGTVSGLIMQIDNLDMIKEALGVSLGTTFLGLIVAICLRAVDAIWVSKKLSATRLQFDQFEKRFQIVALDTQMTKDKQQEND